MRPEILSGVPGVAAATVQSSLLLCVLQKELLPAVAHLLSAAVVFSALSSPAG